MKKETFWMYDIHFDEHVYPVLAEESSIDGFWEVQDVDFLFEIGEGIYLTEKEATIACLEELYDERNRIDSAIAKLEATL